MSDNSKINKDIISEQDYTIKMTPFPNTPGSDSPGDSEKDAGAEFSMGVNFHPIEDNFIKSIDSSNEETVDVEKENETNLSLTTRRSNAISNQKLKEKYRLRDKAAIVYSNLPSPAEDLGRSSDTN